MNKFLDLAVDIAFGVIAWLAVLAFSQLFSSWYLLRSDQALLGLFEVLLVIGVISPIAIGTALGRVLRSGNPYMWWVVVAGIGVLVAAVAVVLSMVLSQFTVDEGPVLMVWAGAVLVLFALINLALSPAIRAAQRGGGKSKKGTTVASGKKGAGEQGAGKQGAGQVASKTAEAEAAAPSPAQQVTQPPAG